MIKLTLSQVKLEIKKRNEIIDSHNEIINLMKWLKMNSPFIIELENMIENENEIIKCLETIKEGLDP